MNYKRRTPKRQKWARRGYWSEGKFHKAKVLYKEFLKEKQKLASRSVAGQSSDKG